MAHEKFSIGEALKYGWATFKSHALFLILFLVTLGLIDLAITYPGRRIGGIVGLFVQLIASLINLLLGMAAIRIALDIYDHGGPQISRVKTIFPQYLSYLAARILCTLIVGGVYIVLYVCRGVIPPLISSVIFLIWFPFAAIFAYRFFFVSYLIIDRNSGPVDALGESREITDGYKWNLFWLSLVLIILIAPGPFCYALSGPMIIAGADSQSAAVAAFGVALKYIGLVLMPTLVVTIPIVIMATVYVYRHLNPAPAAA